MSAEAETLHDHFCHKTTLRISEPQPQYGLVQLNAYFKGELISCDVNRDEFLAAVERVLGVRVEEVFDLSP